MIMGLSVCMMFLLYLNSVSSCVVGVSLILVLSIMASCLTECVEMSGLFLFDFLSLCLVVLSVYVTLLMYMSSLNSARFKAFSVLILSIMILLVFSFCVNSLIFFYVFFESVLLPTFALIIGWGYQPERVQAVMYMVVYTVIGSMPLLYGLSKLYLSGKSTCVMGVESMVCKSEKVFPWIFLLAFIVKLPVFPFHIWLPKAHVEAPVSGSMILAGLLLKLGGYGLIRLMMMLDMSWLSAGTMVPLFVGLWGGVLTSFVCIRQVDLKMLVAYSSIGHMSFVLLGCLSGSSLGAMGGLLIMIGHGLCSSGLFALVNVLYVNSESRLISMNKGHLIIVPVISFICFLLASSNMAAPPSLNLMGEILVFIVGAFMSWYVLILLGIMSFMSACYSLYLYVSTQHGKSGKFYEFKKKLSFNDCAMLLFHWIPLNFLFLFVA